MIGADDAEVKHEDSLPEGRRSVQYDDASAQLPFVMFVLLRDFIHEKTGMYFTDQQHGVFAGKVAGLVRELAGGSALDLYHMLRAEQDNGPLMSRVVAAITVSETWFFREITQLRVLIASVLPRLLASRDVDREPVRIWCCACATGEEALTLAMLVESAHPEWFRHLRIVATDINAESVAKARMGMFRERAFRSTPEEFRTRYFRSYGDMQIMHPDILQRVHFRHGNLLDASLAKSMWPADVILCRNVLIYFSDSSMVAALRNFRSVLRDNGVLMMGSSESLQRFKLPWRLCEIDGAFMYEPIATGTGDGVQHAH